MRTHPLGALALVLSVAVLPACGGGNGSGKSTLAGNSGTVTPTSSAAPSTPGASSGTTASPGSVPASGKPPAGSSSPGTSGTSATPTPTMPPRKIAPLHAEVAKTCVTPGQAQTLRIQTAPKPDGQEPMIVVFDNVYSDGKDGQHYGGIEQNGRADAEGKYTKIWIVAVNTPLGQARVDIAVAGQPGTNTKQLYYDVKRTC